MSNITNYFKSLIRSLILVFLKSNKISIILNYHRIGNVNPQNPYHRLHTVSLTTFKLQIKLCSLIGKFVSLDEITDSKLNSRINFSITFDDISCSTYEALSWLDKSKIPFTICPCQTITEYGMSWRDKVYFIDKYLENEDALNAIRKKFPLIKIDSRDKFYEVSKSKIFDQTIMIEDVVEKLFKKVPFQSDKFLSTKNYFDASDLVKMRNEFRSLEIANHSINHSNLISLSINQLNLEVEGCDKYLKSLLKITPKYFAVPFGEFESQLAIKLSKISRLNKKKAVLWVANQYNVDTGPTSNKIKQLARFHSAPSLIGLLKQIVVSFMKQDFISSIQEIKIENSLNCQVVSNPDSSNILAFEDISRPTKDYASDPKFLREVYIKNPFLEGKAHTFAEIKGDHVIAIGQNLPLPFSGLKDYKVINIFGNWRSVRGASKIGVASILGKSIKEYPLIMSYKPSKYIEPSFIKMGWTALRLCRYNSKLNKLGSHIPSQDLVVTDKLEEIKDLIHFNNKSSETIQLELSEEFLKWRVQGYPLAKYLYFFLNNYEGEKALVIAQYKAKQLLFLDQRFSSSLAFSKILEKIIGFASHRDFETITAETSCRQSQKVLANSLINPEISYGTCYFHQRGNNENLAEKKIIITPLSSDCLLRGLPGTSY